MIDVLEPGYAPTCVPYGDGWNLQRRVHREVVDDLRDDTLILLEHEAVFTAGSRTEERERPSLGPTPVVDVDRGGKITWHGPGQLVGYPIVRIGAQREIVGHVRRLEACLIDALAGVGVTGFRVTGRTGVWVGDEGNPGKIAAIGVRVERGVSLHGFALNCNNGLDPFDDIVPCGISDASVTTIRHETGRDLSPATMATTVRRAVINAFETVPA